MRPEVDFVNTLIPTGDVVAMLGDMQGNVDPFETFEDGATLAHLMHRAGLFTSVGEARRNGFNRPVPTGFSQFRVGKHRTLVTIVNT